jgi:tetraacyldisaccharide 4'-kinase
MREPAFWRRPGALAGCLLAPLGAIYGAVAAWRMARPGASAGVPVLCIGNLTAGGAGKTPAAMTVARLLQQDGKKPFVLSRGYGGRLAGPVRVDAQAHGAADVGDEPLLLANVAPAIVARDRVAGAQAARAAGADIIVMDDGFQNPSLRKDVSLIVVDGRGGIGNGLVFPAGPLRAPLAAQLARAQALLVIGEPSGAAAVLAAAPGVPVFHGRLEPDEQAVAALRPHKVLAFAGIGDSHKFFRTLEDAGIDVRARQPFADHHRFSAAEAADLIARAKRDGLTLVTTEKDFARLKGEPQLDALAQQARALPVRLVVTEADAFRQFVLAAAG